MWTYCGLVVLLVGFSAAELSHCRVVNFGSPILKEGIVNFIYTMNTKCVLCYEEATKLGALKINMERAGIDVNMAVGLNTLPIKKLPPQSQIDIHRVWAKLGKENGNVYVFDKCGRFVYTVITPWSKQVYPFVGMAVMSALIDNPCGECESSSEEQLQNTDDNASSEIISEEETADENFIHQNHTLKDSVIPLTIIYRNQHQHIEGNHKVKYDVIEHRTDDPTYHGHVKADIEIKPFDLFDSDINFLNSTTNIEDNNSAKSKHSEQLSDYDNGSEMNSINENETERLLTHYEPIAKWMYCVKTIMGMRHVYSKETPPTVTI